MTIPDHEKQCPIPHCPIPNTCRLFRGCQWDHLDPTMRSLIETDQLKPMARRLWPPEKD